MKKYSVVICLLSIFVWSCSPSKKLEQANINSKKTACKQTGMASYYSDKFIGKPTASGELYQATALTAAHKTLPFGTKVKVTLLKNNLSVVVKINDRGPFTKGRIIDLSMAAAKKINLVQMGVGEVKIECIP